MNLPRTFSRSLSRRPSKPPDQPPSYEEITARPATSTLTRTGAGAPDLSDITIDGTLIYPTQPPATALYELSHGLDVGFSTIGVSRLIPRSSEDANQRMNPRYKHIYDFTQLIFSTTVEIAGKRRSALSGFVYLKTKGHLRQGWEVWHKTKDVHGQEHDILLYRVKPTWHPQKQRQLEWESATRAPVAVETLRRPDEKNSRPRLQILTDLNDIMLDALVTAWCARIWIRQQLLHDARERDIDTMRRKMSYGSELRPNSGTIFQLR